MQTYLELLDDVFRNGAEKRDRTGVGTRSLFGRQLRFDLANAFPLLTTKRVHFKSVLVELLWFLRGDTNIDFLHQHGVTIWDEWADASGDLGPVYGHQFRSWTAKDRNIDQIVEVEQQIRTNPDSRRLIVSTWNVGDVHKMALPPCHGNIIQFYIADGRLSCQMYQRSCDLFLGVPFNIASYAAFTMMMAATTGYQPGDFIHVLGDVHIYSNHYEQVREQLSRSPRPLPRLNILRTPASVVDFVYEDFELIDYNPHPRITAPVAV